VRTAVVRVRVDPDGQLTGAQLTDGMVNLRDLAAPAGIDVLENNVAAMPAARREVEMLMVGEPDDLKATAVALCAKAFGTEPEPGVLTYISRGTDDDAHGVLAGFGLSGDVKRVPGDDGSTRRWRRRSTAKCTSARRSSITRPGISGSPARPAPRCRTC
jgi:hypothetical protein